MGKTRDLFWRRPWHPTPVLLPGKSHGWRSLVGYSHGVAESRTRLSDFPFIFLFPALEKEMETHSSVLAWRIPGTGEPGGLPSVGSHRVRHDCSDLAAAAAVEISSRRLDTKETFHAKMGTRKDRLTEAEDIKKRWQEYTELYKKDLNESKPQWHGHSPRARHPGM